jgi:hypothetical protein
MATDTEVHDEYFYGNSTDPDWVLYALWLHISQVGAVGNAVIRIVNDGVDDAIMTGGVLGATPSAATDFKTDDFVCIEPVEEYPGGGRWQCLLVRKVSSIDYILAPDGGWDSVAYGAPASGNNYGFGSGVNPDPVITTPSVPVMGNFTSTYGSLRMTSCNRDTYNGGADFYTYFRFLEKQAGIDPLLDGFRVGGYAPSDVTNDTKPVCALAGIAAMNSGSAGHYWSTYLVGDSDNDNRSPLEYAHTTQLASAGYCQVQGDGMMLYGADRSNQIVSAAPVLVSLDDSKFLGLFGVYDMRMIDGALPDGLADYPQGYFVSSQFLFRWAP